MRGDPPIWRRYLRLFGPDAEADIDDEMRHQIAGVIAPKFRLEALWHFSTYSGNFSTPDWSIADLGYIEKHCPGPQCTSENVLYLLHCSPGKSLRVRSKHYAKWPYWLKPKLIGSVLQLMEPSDFEQDDKTNNCQPPECPPYTEPDGEGCVGSEPYTGGGVPPGEEYPPPYYVCYWYQYTYYNYNGNGQWVALYVWYEAECEPL
ncbi:MAG: hypothetical protein ACRENP_22060 [Longimicrobiales bacterium]